jgi:hypothetical protein
VAEVIAAGAWASDVQELWIERVGHLDLSRIKKVLGPLVARHGYQHVRPALVEYADNWDKRRRRLEDFVQPDRFELMQSWAGARNGDGTDLTPKGEAIWAIVLAGG